MIFMFHRPPNPSVVGLGPGQKLRIKRRFSSYNPSRRGCWGFGRFDFNDWEPANYHQPLAERTAPMTQRTFELY